MSVVSNEVLLEKIENLHDKVDTQSSVNLKTLAQATDTNGKVKELQIQQAVNDERFKMTKTLFYVLGTVVLAIGGWLARDYVISQKNLIQIIDQRIQANNDKYFEK